MKTAFRASMIIAALPALGYTNCEYFADTTVPASDTTVPIAGTRYMDHDGGDAIRFHQFHESVYDVGKDYVILPFGFDSGGVQELRVSRSATRYCSSGGIGSITHYHYLTETDSGSEGIGDEVSNGRYLLFTFNPSDFTSGDCEVDMGWSIEVTDYHGNVTTGSGGISYVPPSARASIRPQ